MQNITLSWCYLNINFQGLCSMHLLSVATDMHGYLQSEWNKRPFDSNSRVK